MEAPVQRERNQRLPRRKLEKLCRQLAQIRQSGKSKHLGCFADEAEAAKAYDTAATELREQHLGALASRRFCELPRVKHQSSPRQKQRLPRRDLEQV